jgi:hypothetical protein
MKLNLTWKSTLDQIEIQVQLIKTCLDQHLINIEKFEINNVPFYFFLLLLSRIGRRRRKKRKKTFSLLFLLDFNIFILCSLPSFTYLRVNIEYCVVSIDRRSTFSCSFCCIGCTKLSKKHNYFIFQSMYNNFDFK